MESVPGRTPQWASVSVASANTQGQLDTELVGTIPPWLNGCLYRNGAGVYKVKDTDIKHFFDGFSVIHKFTISDGKITYSSSLLDTCTLADALGIKRIIPTARGLASLDDPCKSIFKGHFAMFPPERTDNTNVNIVQFADSLYALTETPTVNQIHPDKLNRLALIDLTQVVAIHTGTAHPHFGSNGDMFSYGTNFDYRRAYNIVKIPRPPLLTAEILASISSRWPTNISYNHSFGMSENYFVILDQPVTFNTTKFDLTRSDIQGMAETLALRHGEPLQFHIIDRRNNKRLRTIYETDSSFVFHFVNCYEEEDYLIVDVIIYHDISAILRLYVDSLKKTNFQIPDAGSFARFVLPLNADNVPCDVNLVSLLGSKATAIKDFDATNTIIVTPDFLLPDKINMELPRINYDFCAGRRHRYVYGNAIFSSYYRLVKLDVQEKTVKEWRLTQYYYPGEPIFVASPDAKEEDDGIILSPVLCETLDERSFLLILDARSFTEIARAYIPENVQMSMTFHGTYTKQTQVNGDSAAVSIHL
ncbi:unnamed protein product [Candidula unifasciata]|uniref:Uncharacterized protein n=1 Tax=Candidula unifasciata TaxID=100452 RepID=A0A8S3ZSZ9_9EUPU|nr:unnamed protein product [Candidula unifasciata]